MIELTLAQALVKITILDEVTRLLEKYPQYDNYHEGWLLAQTGREIKYKSADIPKGEFVIAKYQPEKWLDVSGFDTTFVRLGTNYNDEKTAYHYGCHMRDLVWLETGA